MSIQVYDDMPVNERFGYIHEDGTKERNQHRTSTTTESETKIIKKDESKMNRYWFFSWHITYLSYEPELYPGDVKVERSSVAVRVDEGHWLETKNKGKNTNSIYWNI